MTWITIGSVAMRYHGIGNREPKDYDVLTDTVLTPPPRQNGLRVEAFWHPSLASYFSDVRIATPDELYTIKVSHSFWDLRNGSWSKHMYDQEQLRRHDATLIGPLYSILYPIWEERYGCKRLDLAQDAATFFGPGIRRYYVHDSIHAAITDGEPMYKRILEPGAEVNVDAAALRALPPDQKLRLWREEAAVLALERTLIPAVEAGRPVTRGDVRIAWASAVKTLITSATRGESALWLSTHYHEMRAPDDFWDRFWAGQAKLTPMGE